MITIEIKDQSFEIANSYEELTLGQYIDIIKANESKIKLEGNAADIEIISILSDKPEELKPLLWQFSVDDFNELTSYFDWVQDTTILEKFKGLKPLEKITIDNVNYGIISNYNKMSLGEIVSFETLLKQEQSDFHRLEIVFGTLLRPLNEEGKLIEFSEEVFLNILKVQYRIKMIDIYSVIAFFLNGEKKYIKDNTKGFSIIKNTQLKD